MTNTGGPYLAAALICERVLQETDGAISVIRVIDRVIFLTEDRQPEKITVLLGLKSGAARGRFRLRVIVEKPSGEPGPTFESPVFFEGEDRGVNVVLQTLFEPDQEGLYWFDVWFEDERISRIPLRAMFQGMPRVENP